MLQTEVTKNVIALSRQARKERFITYFSEPWRLCVFARDTFFLIFSLSQNFKYLWLDFGFGILDCSDLILNFGFRPIENRQSKIQNVFKLSSSSSPQPKLLDTS